MGVKGRTTPSAGRAKPQALNRLRQFLDGPALEDNAEAPLPSPALPNHTLARPTQLRLALGLITPAAIARNHSGAGAIFAELRPLDLNAHRGFFTSFQAAAMVGGNSGQEQ